MATDKGLDRQDLIPSRNKIFLFSMASRLALGPTQHLKGYLKGSFLRSKAGRE
jgi:hypothetical protein